MIDVTEQALVFECAGSRLVGVLAQPARPKPIAVLVVVGGPQYRVGSHRQFVQMSRGLASAGFAVLRFDVRGMGDSEGDQRSFEDLDDDIAAAADALLSRQPAGTRLAMWGLCDGASAALLYIDRRGDARVAGLALLNPWVRSEASLARTQVRYYYGQRLMQRDFWEKLLRGGVGLAAIGGLLKSLATTLRARSTRLEPELDFRSRMARAWTTFDQPVLLMLSERDYTAREFEDSVTSQACWRGAFSREALQICRLAQADHTLSSKAAKAMAQNELEHWLDSLTAPGGVQAA